MLILRAERRDIPGTARPGVNHSRSACCLSVCLFVCLFVCVGGGGGGGGGGCEVAAPQVHRRKPPFKLSTVQTSPHCIQRERRKGTFSGNGIQYHPGVVLYSSTVSSHRRLSCSRPRFILGEKKPNEAKANAALGSSRLVSVRRRGRAEPNRKTHGIRTPWWLKTSLQRGSTPCDHAHERYSSIESCPRAP